MCRFELENLQILSAEIAELFRIKMTVKKLTHDEKLDWSSPNTVKY